MKQLYCAGDVTVEYEHAKSLSRLTLTDTTPECGATYTNTTLCMVYRLDSTRIRASVGGSLQSGMNTMNDSGSWDSDRRLCRQTMTLDLQSTTPGYQVVTTWMADCLRTGKPAW